jgi:diamine N-acetyltransferase
MISAAVQMLKSNHSLINAYPFYSYSIDISPTKTLIFMNIFIRGRMYVFPQVILQTRKITEDNFIDAFNLKLAQGQDRFVSHPVRSLAQAYVYREQCQPFGSSNRVALTCNKDNIHAIKLYKSKGFSETGTVYDDETELSLTLE